MSLALAKLPSARDITKKMKIYTTNHQQANTIRIVAKRAHRVNDNQLFAFLAKFAPYVTHETVIYTRGNDSNNTENLYSFIGKYTHDAPIYARQTFVYAEHAPTLYDMRLAVIHSALLQMLANAAKREYAAKNENAILDDKSALAIAAHNSTTAYAKFVEMAIDAKLFSDDEKLQTIAREFAKNGGTAPFANVPNIPLVHTQDLAYVVPSQRTARALNVPNVEIDVDALLSAQFTTSDTMTTSDAN